VLCSWSGQPRTQHDCHHDRKVKPEAATEVTELLMMGRTTLETSWAVNKRQDNKLKNFCIWLVIYLKCTMMHGLTNLKPLHFLTLNPLNAELNPICHLLALLGAHHILHISRVRVKPLNFLNIVTVHLSTYEDGTEFSETSAYKIQKPGNYPEESIQH